MDEHVAVFAATLNLDTKTGSSMGVMPSYSIAINKAGNAIGDKVASGFSSYKLTDILLDELEFDGVISSDFLITTDDMRPWGVEDLSYTMRHLAAMRAGMMQFGGEADLQVMRGAYELGILADRAGMQKTTDSSEGMPVFTHEYYTNDSESEWNEYITECAYKIVRNLLYTGIFENPYLSSENLRESNSNTESIEMGYEAQLDGVVMLKNAGNVLESASEEKKTVYMPMQITADAEASADIAQAHATGDWSSIGFEDTTYGGVISYAFDWDLANEYFNVVTDELSEEADLSNLTEEDIIRRTDFTDVDFALLNVTAPKNGSGYDAEAVSLDAEAGELDNGYYPISLIYNDYYADPEIVREYPLGVDDNEELEWIEAGGEMGKSRYYGGKTTPGNTADLDLILSTKERIGDLPLVVSITATGPFCLYEFEESTDAILVNFGVSSRAMLENIAGVHEPQGLLPIQLPVNMETVETQYEDVARDMECHVDSEGNTYDFAYGMNFSGVINDERVATYK